MPERARSPSEASPGARLRRRWPLWLFLVAWGLLMAVPPAALLRVRGAWLEELADSAVQEDWEAFRREMAAQAGGAGPVQRKIPRSAEPPLRVWLRDYVGLAITAWLVLGGTLGAFLGVMVAGATAPSGAGTDADGRHSPNTTPAVAATTRKSTRTMPSTPRSENTGEDLSRDGG